MRFLLLSAVFVASSLFSTNVRSQEQYASVEITPEKTHIVAGEEIQLATTISLKPEWHVYWLNPGDSGIPVTINWDKPEGFNIEGIKWPTPDKISYEVLMNYGYKDKVTLLQKLRAPDTLPNGKIALSAKVDLLVCNEICIPESSTVSIDLNNPDLTPKENRTLIDESTKKLPEPIKGDFAYSDIEKKLNLVLKLDDMGSFKDADPAKIDFFPENLGIVNALTPPVVSVDGNTIYLTFERAEQPTDKIENLSGVLVLTGETGENKGFAISAKRDQGMALAPDAKKNTNEIKIHSETITLVSAFAFALLGGLILNLMPCVFPVLSMKALSLMKMSEKEQAIARRHGLAYTAGVILSFVAIGGLLILIKSSGQAIGWGFQLQNPIIVALLAYLLFMIGLNLVGFFEVGTRLGNLGDKLTRKSGLSGSFFTGVLATVVATPCTAPFMGAAMGYALVQPAIISMGIFAALGLGLALPYLLMAYIPAARRILPRPGAWMNTFKQFLAFPIFASAIWLTWVVAQQSGTYSILIVMGSMLSLAFSVWLSHKHGHLAHILMYVFIFLPLLSLNLLTPMPDRHELGENFTEQKLEDALNTKDPVFVEMTAAWCITCKINHVTSLGIDSTKNLFQTKNVRYLIGDWTNYNAEITEYLRHFQRNGVPLYIYYGAPDEKTGERPEPEILPQVLTPQIVEQAIGP